VFGSEQFPGGIAEEWQDPARWPELDAIANSNPNDERLVRMHFDDRVKFQGLPSYKQRNAPEGPGATSTPYTAHPDYAQMKARVSVAKQLVLQTSETFAAHRAKDVWQHIPRFLPKAVPGMTKAAELRPPPHPGHRATPAPFVAPIPKAPGQVWSPQPEGIDPVPEPKASGAYWDHSNWWQSSWSDEARPIAPSPNKGKGKRQRSHERHWTDYPNTFKHQRHH
jgi:hypothetical protein